MSRAWRGFVCLVVSLALALAPKSAWGKSALGRVAAEIGRGVSGPPQNTTIVVAPLKSDVRAPKASALVLTLGRLVAGTVGGGVQVGPAPMTLREARHFVGRKRRLVHVVPVIERGLLRVAANVYDRMPTVWQRAKGLSYPVGHVFASARIDAELRGYLEPIQLERVTVRRFSHAERDVTALACGDVAGDGVVELVIVSDERISIGRLAKGAFVPRLHRDWNAIVPRAPVGLRASIASAVILDEPNGPRLAVGSTERSGVLLDSGLGVRRELAGIPLGSHERLVCGALRAETALIAPDLFACDDVATKRRVVATPRAAFDALALGMVESQRGERAALVAERSPLGEVLVQSGKTKWTLPKGQGAQLAIGDLNQDGVAELASTLDGNEDDAIVIHSLEASGPVARKAFPAPGGVRALAFCPPERRGIPALAAIVQDEVWLVR